MKTYSQAHLKQCVTHAVRKHAQGSEQGGLDPITHCKNFNRSLGSSCLVEKNDKEDNDRDVWGGRNKNEQLPSHTDTLRVVFLWAGCSALTVQPLENCGREL